MAQPTPATLLQSLAAALAAGAVEDAATLRRVAEALEAARAAGALEGRLASEAPDLAAALEDVELAADAVAHLRDLVAEAQAAGAAVPDGPEPTGAASQKRDAETVDLVGDFLEESGEGLARADELLLAIEMGADDKEKINALFRVFHTIKGVAGFLELSEIVSLAHITETLLNQVREGKRPLTGEAFEATFEATARLRLQLAALRQAVDARADLKPDRAVPALVTRLKTLIDGAPEEATPPTGKDFVIKKGPVDASGQPLFVVRQPATGPRPPAVAAPAAPAVETPAPAPAPAPVLAAKAAGAPPPVPPGAGAPAGAGGGAIRDTVKVDLERVDSMVEMIGELIIVESMVVHAPELANLASLKLRNYLNQLGKISRDLQNVAMRMRMVPVRGAFQKMARLVRELSRKTGKDVVLETQGEETEMDRSMVERIEDPLVHLVRNALDHGIEPPPDRVAAGKAERSALRLAAFHEGGSIVVELSDDGRGLQREKILKKAREKGLVEEGRELSDSEVFGLIFLPGFSTAAQVTEISGRGVGMDVVKRNIEGMRGRVSVTSRPGQGSTFRMVLPLTLAIIEGMLVACGKERYIIPSLAIIESLRPTEEMVARVAGRGEVINVRGEILPLLRLHRLLQMEGEDRPATEAHVVVLEGLGRKAGLLVDDVLTQQQVVIKPLGHGMGDTDFLAGAAILSDGRVGLILNVDRLTSLAARGARREAAVGT